MEQLVFLLAMSVCALVPFAATAWLAWSRRWVAVAGSLAILAGCFLGLIYATNHDVGLDPIKAISGALVFALPGLIGGVGGALVGVVLGWHARRRDRKR